MIGQFTGGSAQGVVGKVHTDSRGTCGYRSVSVALHIESGSIESGLSINHKLVASIMQDLQLHRLPKRGTRWRYLIAIRTVSDLVHRNSTNEGAINFGDGYQGTSNERRSFCV